MITTFLEQRLRPHDVRETLADLAANISSMAALIFKNTCRPCRTILPAV
jgi:hypothetical protein